VSTTKATNIHSTGALSAAREPRGYSLDDVAARSGLAVAEVATLERERIERAMTRPSLEISRRDRDWDGAVADSPIGVAPEPTVDSRIDSPS
jgi:transcriptional regulator with XRE-family HTH domain